MELKFFDDISQEFYSIKQFNFVPRIQPKKERKSPSPLNLIKVNNEDKANLSDEKKYSKTNKKIKNLKSTNSLNLPNKLNRIKINNINNVNKGNYSNNSILNKLLKKKKKKLIIAV